MNCGLRIALIRHATTEGNKRGVYLGCGSDNGISESGRVSTLEFSEHMRKSVSDKCEITEYYENALLFVSPLKRCAETADILFPGKTKIVIDEIKEMDFGDFEGLGYEDLNGNAYYQEWIDSDGQLPFPNGEDKEGFIKRTMDGFEKILRKCYETCSRKESDEAFQDAVVICHAGTVMAVMSSLTGMNYFDFHVDNLGGYILEAKTDGNKIFDLAFECI